MARDLSAELRGHEAVPFWNPEPGDQVVGELLRYEDRVTKFGPARVAVVDQDDGQGRVGVWLTAAVLKTLFEREQPRPGDHVGVKFIGPAPGKNYKLYALLVDRAEQVTPAPSSAAPTASRVAPRAVASGSVSRGPAGSDDTDPFTD